MSTTDLSFVTILAPASGIGDMPLGCPVANGFPPCNHLCGGGWPGTHITHDNMLRALALRQLVVESLGCGPLQEQARHWSRLYLSA